MLTDPGYLFVQFLNGLQFSMLLFLLSVGLSVTFGLMNFVNLAHGALYACGAFIGYSIAVWTGSFWAAFLLAPLAVCVIGAVLYGVLIRQVRSAGPLTQVLLTFGLIFIFLDAFRVIWGDLALGVSAPTLLATNIHIFGQTYPLYRLFLIALGLAVYLILWLALERTNIGAMVRASVDNAEMASCLGVNVERLFFAVFCTGCLLAGLAGVAAAPIFSVYPGMDLEILIPTLIVVVIGGLGSLKGAIVGSLLIGMLQTFGQVLIPQLAGSLSYILLGATLILRPEGLFPARAH
ncbi:branched-chain amino acid transport system permease protein [Rhodobium orientis]|uniref:Branched-chain amino acid ABC transporter permease n=1 Tax=Rhodobium orientis TaxID=34017 RepID=A0A327JFG2_9HYPH|nr:branched-chain amino acid ABC transporter permease [Rhodobium orientis]MBB4305703.1 branched-chain amino acid transport system permease protein [Rhodobium orientis]MBK5947882.1 branched-chain amino acid ABC transporter permease [Rhodobium orientis]RAI24309.1 branched-chain amino acid ABC transporter permease [Rhodobium orientis]